MDGSDDAQADLSGRAAPPAELLRRAISHVESMLERLEGTAGGAPTSAPAPAVTGRSAEAARLRRAAESEAAAIVSAAQAEADQIRHDAASDVESALREADRIREDAARPDEPGGPLPPA